jgi:hypothetical protein
MNSTIHPEYWLTFALLVVQTNGVIAQDPQPPRQGGGDKLPAILAAKPLPEDPKDDALRKLLKARYNEAVAEMKDCFLEFQAGRTTIDSMLGASQRVQQAGLQLSSSPADRVKLLESFLEMAKEVERINQALVEAGKVRSAELHRARYVRIDTEIRLLRAKQEAAKAKDK